MNKIIQGYPCMIQKLRLGSQKKNNEVIHIEIVCMCPLDMCVYVFLVYFSVNLSYHYLLRFADRKILVPKGPYIRTSQTNTGNVCLSEILEVCLFVAMQRLEIFAKKYPIITKIILTWPDFFLRLFVWAGQKHCHMSKKNQKNEQHLCLIAHIITKHSQMCV